MVRSELLQKLCNYYPNILRRDIEKILEIIKNNEIIITLFNKMDKNIDSIIIMKGIPYIPFLKFVLG